jgi:hypothetical protein
MKKTEGRKSRDTVPLIRVAVILIFSYTSRKARWETHFQPGAYREIRFTVLRKYVEQAIDTFFT